MRKWHYRFLTGDGLICDKPAVELQDEEYPPAEIVTMVSPTLRIHNEPGYDGPHRRRYEIRDIDFLLGHATYQERT